MSSENTFIVKYDNNVFAPNSSRAIMLHNLLCNGAETDFEPIIEDMDYVKFSYHIKYSIAYTDYYMNCKKELYRYVHATKTFQHPHTGIIETIDKPYLVLVTDDQLRKFVVNNASCFVKNTLFPSNL